MMMDLDVMEKKIHSTPKNVKGAEVEKTITAGMIQSEVNHEMKREAEERKAWFIENFDKLTLLDIYASEWTSETRRKVIRELLQAGAEEDVIKSIIRPEIEEGQVLQKKKMIFLQPAVIVRFITWNMQMLHMNGFSGKNLFFT